MGKEGNMEKSGTDVEILKGPFGEKYNDEAIYNNIGTKKIIDLYFKQKNIMYSHLHNSFDKFLEEDIRNLLLKGSNIFFEKITKDKVYKYKFEYENLSIKPPTIDNEDELMYPSFARLRNLTYGSKLVATIRQIQEITDIATGSITRKIVGQPEYEYPIANIPIMLRSKYCTLNLKKNYNSSECEYDPGGYFVVNGSEKVVMSLERMIDNKPLVFIKKDSSVTTYTVQVNSRSFQNNDIVHVVAIKMKKDNTMILKTPELNGDIPVFILMRALGIESDKDIITYCVYDLNDTDMINIIRLSLDDSKFEGGKIKIRTREDAINYLINKIRVVKKYNETDKDIRLKEKKMHLNSLLKDSFLPSIEGEHMDKGFYLGYMINKLLNCYLGRIPVDDRDSFLNKRIDLPGTLLFELFKQYYKKMLNECNKFFKKRNNDDDNPQNIINQIKPNIIEQGLKASLLTGAWGKKKGVAQMLQILTYPQKLSSLRRVNSPTVDASTNKLTSPRHLHASQEGFLCVSGDTEVILYNGTTKQIKYITEEDMVLTVNKYTLGNETSYIYNYFSKMSDIMIKIETVNNDILKCTVDHPVLKVNFDAYFCDDDDYNNCHMIPAGKLTTYDYVVMTNNNKDHTQSFKLANNMYGVRIKSITIIEPEMVYDFTTESENHTFIANGFVVSNCHIETPDGHKVGLVKNLSLIGNITIIPSSQHYILRGIIKNKIKNIKDVSPEEIIEYTKVFLNGEWIGLTNKPKELYKELKQMKYDGQLTNSSIVHEIKSESEPDELRVLCDSGRLFRPVLRVEDNKILLTKEITDRITNEEFNNPIKISTWNEFMLKNPGIIEYIDVDEYFNAMIAMQPSNVKEMHERIKNSKLILEKYPIDNNYNIINRYDDSVYVYYTHCEIHPSLHLGVIAANIPFVNFNQGPRNMFQYSQARQAMGIYISNYRDRLDISYILFHSQKPLVNTMFMKYINTDKLAFGENAVVAIACYTGYNQDDSVIINKSAIDRGFFRSTSLKKYMTEIKKNQSTSQDDIFVKPDPSKVTGMRHGSYDKLNEKGYVPEETEIVNGDIIIGKISPIQPIGQTNKTFKDSSEIYKSHDAGVIDKVYTNILNNEGYEMIKMRVRSMRIPHIGDKFCLLDNAEVLTSYGWKNIKEITKCDKVATLHENKYLRYEQPIDVYNFDYNGDMYKLRSKFIDFDVTIDHELYVMKNNKNIFERIPAIETFGKSVRFKKDCINDMISNEYNTFSFLDITIDKYLPNYVYNYSQSEAIKLLEYILTKSYKKNMIITPNKKYADDVMKLTIHAGISSRIITKKNKYIIKINKNKNIPLITKNNSSQQLYNYNGKVYCLEVPSHVFMIRVNGKNFWIGNCSRHAQKGTCGITLPQADMPFSKEGITPDIIVNPNAIPSRMTIGQLVECLVGKIGAVEGHEVDGTPFKQIDIEGLKDRLESLGYNRHGTEYLYNGMTGKKMKTMIFIGPTYYQRLKHMVTDKIHGRSRGPRTLLTRQPPEGRSREGGLRFGEMERDSIIAHGMGRFLKERLLETADAYSTYVCNDCGLFAQRVLKKENKSYETLNDIYICPGCKNVNNIVKVRIPYAFKLLIQELMSMSIVSRIRINDN